MNRNRIAVLSAATVTVAALGLSGCGGDDRQADKPVTVPSTSAVVTTPAPPPAHPLPAPEALTGVLYRLADVNVPGAEKVGLVEQATPDDAEALDKFGRALADNGFTPLNFEATDLAWSENDSRNVIATIHVTAGEGDAPGQFTFPMEFTPKGPDWQLTRNTADMLLEMGAAAGGGQSEPATTPTPTP
ncbi:hypothetical protein [Mycolicibacterium smegmatis]|uniref:LppK n=3 Tax=Mycolicibacterium smegmatis TaxID=1772 RepID=I7FNJ3_MYCS2|nr:hypothetical protein [Mycolicibacterium smegmatis]ABK71933.1 LppK protein [Mycolicibacterium smegmatis MC2 155]AFP40273.1 LppK [Mycolicibacterium smegmatis MC2 155]AIU09021.1 lipoprotein lppK [Mycolicibacterium smegmatis MC2 155]AIU15646.1 lipoprotein lppK [Mycolicibacterium smegmatis]AIU22269.1 lipoprotein lppK [Mycolicibacterium smegmatis]